MLEFQKDETKFWKIIYTNDNLKTMDNDKIKIFDLVHYPSSITNKFHIITDFVKELSDHLGNDFDDWFYNLLYNIQNDEENKHKIVLRNIPQLKEYVNEYLDYQNLDYSQFVDETKAKKNSILFLEDEIKMILYISSYLKIYSFIFNTKLRFGKNFHKIVYNEIVKEITETDIIFKIYNVISTKTFRYNLTDKYMWDYIKLIQCKDIGVHVIEIFNFIMNYILVLCEKDRNPITYFVGVVDESVKWFLRSVYKNTIVYDDNISNEDIKTSSLNNLKVYTYNDTLEKLTTISMNKITEMIEKKYLLTIGDDVNDELITSFQNGLSNIEYISPICESLTFPILSELTEVPYNYFKVLKPKFCALLSAYTYYMMESVFKSEYNSLLQLLMYYPIKQPSLTTTYKIKSIKEFINNQNKIKDFCGFDTKPFLYDKMCHIVGRLSRINFKHLIDGKEMTGNPLSKIELDVILFYSNYFAGNFKKQFKQMSILLDKDF